MLFAREAGDAIDPGLFDAAVAVAVQDVVDHQHRVRRSLLTFVGCLILEPR